jgi:hypothetical protein
VSKVVRDQVLDKLASPSRSSDRNKSRTSPARSTYTHQARGCRCCCPAAIRHALAARRAIGDPADGVEMVARDCGNGCIRRNCVLRHPSAAHVHYRDRASADVGRRHAVFACVCQCRRRPLCRKVDAGRDFFSSATLVSHAFASTG